MKKTQNSQASLSEAGRANLKSQIFFVLFTVHCSLFTAVAFAADGAEHVSSWKDWFWPVINFAVLVALLVYMLKKFDIKAALKKRTEMIEKSLKEAEEAKQLAQKALDEVRGRLKNTDREMTEIIEATKISGEKEKAALIAEGEKLKNIILRQAKTNIEFELQKARKAIKSEAALAALELAEKQIKEQLGKKEQLTLIDEYIKKIEVKS
ncbi:MAG: ATP synthase F0 subunit B [Nitrospirota bacterium]